MPVRRMGSNSISEEGGVDEENGSVGSTQPPSGEETSSANTSEGGGTRRRRVPFVSRHRKALEYIRSDSIASRRHQVPHGAATVASETDELLDNNAERGSSNGSTNGEERVPPAKRPSQTMDSLMMHSTVLKNQFRKYANKQVDSLAKKKPSDWADTFFPFCTWFRHYDYKTTFVKDLIAGLTVGVMIIPQSMSYAKLAGLSVEYGLYSALMPVFAYSVFGSSRQLAVGPVALISLLLSTGIDNIMSSRGIDEEDPTYDKAYVQLAIQISFLVGITYIVMGLLRLGFVTIFLSHAVISGFTTGAAVIIGMSQVKYIFGYDVPRSNELHEMIHNILVNIDQFNWRTFIMGMLSVAFLLAFKTIGKTYPRLKIMRALGPLAVTTLSIVLTVTLNLNERGIPIVKYIPEGFPTVTVDLWFPISDLDQVFMFTISIVIVGFMESIAIAKSLASKHKYEIDSSVELIGLGMSNLIGSVFQSYPVTGSFSRSAVNHDSGAETGVSGMITGTLVAFVLLFLTPVFEKMPLNVLAAIVISGVIGLLDYEEAANLWKVHKFDFGVWCTACFGTMFLGVEMGLAIAVGVSLLIVIYESAYPHTSVLGRLPGTTVYRNVKQYPEAEKYEGIVLVRIDAPLFFANAQNVRDKIRKYRFQAEDELRANNNFEASIKYLVLELAPVSRVDTSALHVLTDMYQTYKSRGQQMIFVNPSLLVTQRMFNSGFMEMVGRQHFFTCLHDAVNWCLENMDQQAMSIYEGSNNGDTPNHGNGDSDDVDGDAAEPAKERLPVDESHF
ncbi:hypothetical protein ACA910_000462 [Epithemia clementina (nom. ined.)]